jgi:restriction endonuclease S subunit
MEVRLGYKLTEVGNIPVEWPVMRLKAITDKIMVGIASAATHAYRENGVPMFRNQNIKAGRLDDSDLLFVAHEYEITYKNKRLRNGDLLTMRTGYPGVTAIVPPQYDSAQSFTTLITRPNQHHAESGYLCFYINSAYGQRFFTQSQIGGAQKNVNVGTLREMPIPLPSIPEQRAIVAVLSDVNALLDGLEQLIAKKRDLKQAAMQQLLTGQARLPEFKDEWEVKRLGELARIQRGASPRPIDSPIWFDDNSSIGWVRISDVTRSGMYLNETLQRLSKLGVQNSRPVETGNLIMSICATVGRPVITALNVCIHDGFVVFDNLQADKYFIYYILKWIEPNWSKYGQTGSQMNLNTALINNTQIKLPNRLEQTAIASILSDMDAEITALEQRRAKTADLKQAIMQELLTGRTRLIKPISQDLKEGKAQSGGRKANVYFIRSVLAAEIVDRLHEEQTFGHVKFEKMIFLAEHLCKVDTGSTYHRDAAGPYDNRAMRSIDSQLRKQKWFDAQKIDGRYRYIPMTNRGGHKEYFERYFSGIRAPFERIIDTFRGFDTEICEIVATLFGAWNDLIQQDTPVSDDAILHEVLNKWNESKKRIPEDRWRRALDWMRNNGFVPVAAGEGTS